MSFFEPVGFVTACLMGVRLIFLVYIPGKRCNCLGHVPRCAAGPSATACGLGCMPEFMIITYEVADLSKKGTHEVVHLYLRETGMTPEVDVG